MSGLMKHERRPMQLNLTIAAATALLLSACGTAASVAPSVADYDYSVDVEMVDMAFVPAELTVHVGDRVHFVFVNEGHIDHEAVIGDQAMQDAHEAENDVGATASHELDAAAEPHATFVAVNKSGTLDYTFTTAGTTILGCHKAGHWAAGMLMTITIEP